MRIVYIANAHSAISRCWISYFIDRGCDVQVISSYPCQPDVLPGAKVYEIPVAFAKFSKIEHGGIDDASDRSLLTKGIASLRNGPLSGFATELRFWLGPLELQRHVRRVRDLIAQISPDLIHAMRIPFEGILAAKATPPEIPMVLSIWGNDFTLWASRNSIIARQTKQALNRANALHCDCRRDLDLAKRDWNFDSNKPATVLPGAGGVERGLFHPGHADPNLRRDLKIADDAPVVFNPRGFRDYVRNDVFFRAIPEVLKRHPKTVFVCAGMQSNPMADRWLRQFAIHENVRLLPSIPRKTMAELFRLASVAVSPSLHDGTPNTLLEAMASGCFPVAGDIESVREWITNEVNGLLCDPTDPESLASAMTRALAEPQMRTYGQKLNLGLIVERAEYSKVMHQAEDFYKNLVKRNGLRAKAQ